MNEAGKGDKRRPTDEQAFAQNYERIFSGKPTRGSFVQDAVTGEMVPRNEYVRSDTPNAPMVMNDIQGYQSMQTGEWIGSRSTHREHLKQHRLIEIGNERIKEAPKPVYNSAEVKRELAKHFYR